MRITTKHHVWHRYMVCTDLQTILKFKYKYGKHIDLRCFTIHKNCIHQRRFCMLAYFVLKITAKTLNFRSPEQQERLTLITFLPLKLHIGFLTGALLIFHSLMPDKGWRVLTFVSLLFGVLKFHSLSSPKILLHLFEEEALFFCWINLM